MSELDVKSKTGTIGALHGLLALPALMEAFELQLRTLRTFYRLARRIAGPAMEVSAPPRETFSIERNFFSTFFLAVTRQLVAGDRFMPLYAMVNQGMRAWVTACDNILDDEYKEVFPFAFPERGRRVRSVLTLMLADRVVTEFATANYHDAEILAKTGSVSLRALAPSALQECAEEQRPVGVLPPEEILDDIHARKTGDLFLAPLALPAAIEKVPKRAARAARIAVESFGLACQILDDMKDMRDDVQAARHNLIISIACRNRGGDERWLAPLRAGGVDQWTAWERFPDATAEAVEVAAARFSASFEALEALGIGLSAPQRRAVVACMYHLLRVPHALALTCAGER